MSSIALLMGLLLLSYIGSVLVGTNKQAGLPSGIEFVGLGFIVGPHALGIVEAPMITDFEPIVQVALGWLAFVVGLDFGRVDGRRVSTASLVLGIGGAAVTGGLVALTAYVLLQAGPLHGIARNDVIVLAAGAGAVCAETARSGVEWVKARWGAKGPIARLLADVGAADDLALVVAAGAIFAIAPSTSVTFALPSWGWFAASLGLGALLGTVTAMLLRGAEDDAVWGALIGTILLGVGAAARFGLCTIFVTFVMGIALAGASPARRVLRKVVGPTERAVSYPMLLLAGARLDPRFVIESRGLTMLVGVVLAVRLVAKVITGRFLRSAAEPGRRISGWTGLMLLSSGPISIACGFVFALRFPGPIGDTLLFCAIASAVLGELVSTLSMKVILTEAGEIVPVAPPAPPSQEPVVPPPPLSSARRFALEGPEDDDAEP